MNNARGEFLPTSAKEMSQLGWDQADVILFSGDAYVDHPSFGIAVIGRVLQKEGFKVAIVPQPNWRDDLRDFRKLGPPKYFFGISSGNMDSMVNHYTAFKRLRNNDAYTPGGKAGQRPDYATTVYSRLVRDLFPGIPIVLGGIEASLRRFTHYDYWKDQLMPPVLVDSGADLLVHGMGEKAIVEIARGLREGLPTGKLTNIPGTAYIERNKENIPPGYLEISSHEACTRDKQVFGKAFTIVETESNKGIQTGLFQQVGKEWVVVNPPYPLGDSHELDAIHDLPFTRLPHPRYEGKGEIPAHEMIRFSINAHRGCFGGCSFCTISAHQGKFIQSRSPGSILREAEKLTKLPGFKGHITDIGGPSANMYKLQGKNLDVCAKCRKPSCIYPSICKNLDIDHTAMNQLYRDARAIPGIKKITIGSGVRYDLLMNEQGYLNPSAKKYFRQLVTHHVSGRLKVAPEHTSPKVLNIMRKPGFNLFRTLQTEFQAICMQEGLNQQLVPYFISSHPGTDESDMAALAREIKELHLQPEQVQGFTPTPMTLASVIYYTGTDPYTGQKVFVERIMENKRKQNEYFFWYKQTRPSNRENIVAKKWGGKTKNRYH